MRVAKLFWGVILIFLGFLFFFSDLGIVRVNWSFLVNLWPVIVIFIGVYFLPSSIRNISTLLLTIIVFTLFFYAIDFRNLSGYNQGTLKGEFEKPSAPFNFGDYETMLAFDYKPDLKYGRLKFAVNGGNYRVNKSDNKLFTLKAEENVWRSFEMNKSQGGDTGIVDLSLTGVKTDRESENPFKLNLHKDLIWQLKLHLGHSKGEFDLSPFTIHKMSVSAMNADLSIKLQEISDNSIVQFRTPGSKLMLRIPEKVAAKVVSAKPIPQRYLEGFESMNPHNHVTNNYQKADHQLTIKFPEPAKQLSIRRY